MISRIYSLLQVFSVFIALTISILIVHSVSASPSAPSNDPNPSSVRRIEHVTDWQFGEHEETIGISPVISANGRYVAFAVRGGLSFTSIYLHDRKTGKHTIITAENTQTQNSVYFRPLDISGDGRYVAFTRVENWADDKLYIYDRVTEETHTSLLNDVFEDRMILSALQISNNGRYIATRAGTGIYWHDRDTDEDGIYDEVGGTTHVTVTETIREYTVTDPIIPQYRPHSAYNTEFYTLSPDGLNLFVNVTIRERNPETSLFETRTVIFDYSVKSGSFISVEIDSSLKTGQLATSADGRYIAYPSCLPDPEAPYRTKCIPNTDALHIIDTTAESEARQHRTANLGTNLTTGNTFGERGIRTPVMSDNGRYIAFVSGIPNLIENDDNNADDVFLYDMVTEEVTLISKSYNGGVASSPFPEGSIHLNHPAPSISATGDAIAFASRLNEYAVSDMNDGRYDVFVSSFDRPIVIFIPGISGSTLVDENGKEYWPDVSLWTEYEKLSLHPDDDTVDIEARDVLRYVVTTDIFDLFDIYGSFVEEFLPSAGFIPYQIGNDSNRRTKVGCDVTNQRNNNPNLFILPYDWRQGNTDSANLLKEYIDCIQLFYSDTNVTIIAHSMGGLIARRYILDNPDHHVNKLITVGSPFLGTPRAIQVMEEGSFIDFVSHRNGKILSKVFPGAHQLLPAESYFRLIADDRGVKPIIERGWDLDTDGIAYEDYNYDNYMKVINQRYSRAPFLPGETTTTFHGYETSIGHQDEWRNDSSTKYLGYYHIYGKDTETVSQIAAILKYMCVDYDRSKHSCRKYEYGNDIDYYYDLGDGTVLLPSASRKIDFMDFNHQEAILVGLTSIKSHAFMLSDNKIRSCILAILGLVISDVATCPAFASKQIEAAAVDTSNTPAGFYLKMYDVNSLSISENEGFTFTHNPEAAQIIPPYINLRRADDRVYELFLDAGKSYTVSVETTKIPGDIQVDHRYRAKSIKSFRYELLPPLTGSKTCLFNFSEASFESLTCSPDQEVISPLKILERENAEDRIAPEIDITINLQDNNHDVTVTATDDKSGVRFILYSLDDKTYQKYESPIQIPKGQVEEVYILAEDWAGNSDRRIFPLIEGSSDEPGTIYLPLIQSQ
ncbi:MAG: alpha/beta fold hydrolase [Chloroflexota bacterium]